MTRIQKNPKNKNNSNCTNKNSVQTAHLQKPEDLMIRLKQNKTKKTFTDNLQEDKIKIKEQERWLWKRNSVPPEGLTVSLYICESRSSYLLCAKYYTARNKNSFEGVNTYRIHGNKECFSLCSFTLTSPNIRTRSQALASGLAPVPNSLLGHTPASWQFEYLRYI